MPGIYIHIPFCKRKCYYCNFYSSVNLRNKEKLVSALLNEIKNRKAYLEEGEIDTIYLGGGTPSLLTIKELDSIFNQINKYFSIIDSPEITLEGNPDDLTIEKLKQLRLTSINRLSIGVQSFFDDDLEYLNRIHNAGDAKQCIQNAQEAGLDNLTIDLIYGIPTLTNQKWQENLNIFISYNIPHLSAYSLTVEKKTPLEKFIRTGKMQEPDDRQSLQHYKTLSETLQTNKFLQYEISNFARPGFISRHNSSYWKGEYYLGIGPSAHSYNGEFRQWNISNIGGYISKIESGENIFEREILTTDQKFNEYIMTSLRTMWGCDVSFINETFGEQYFNHLLGESQQFIDSGLITFEKNTILLTGKGKLFADRLASDLFI